MLGLLGKSLQGFTGRDTSEWAAWKDISVFLMTRRMSGSESIECFKPLMFTDTLHPIRKRQNQQSHRGRSEFKMVYGHFKAGHLYSECDYEVWEVNWPAAGALLLESAFLQLRFHCLQSSFWLQWFHSDWSGRLLRQTHRPALLMWRSCLQSSVKCFTSSNIKAY